jgi:hypothetical protein
VIRARSKAFLSAQRDFAGVEEIAEILPSELHPARRPFLVFIAIVPFGRVPLAKMPAFIPSYEAALLFLDLITAVLLFDQFVRLRSIGVLVLASGYLFDALIIVPNALSLPGAFTPTGLL